MLQRLMAPLHFSAPPIVAELLTCQKYVQSIIIKKYIFNTFYPALSMVGDAVAVSAPALEIQF